MSARSDELAEILAGLQQPQKMISPKYFYDERGSQLFDAITHLPEYYPTETEFGIMHDNIEEIADLASKVNDRMENIGARRLHTVMERLLETISYEASDRSGDNVKIDDAYVNEHLLELVQDQDLSRYIL